MNLKMKCKCGIELEVTAPSGLMIYRIRDEFEAAHKECIVVNTDEDAPHFTAEDFVRFLDQLLSERAKTTIEIEDLKAKLLAEKLNTVAREELSFSCIKCRVEIGVGETRSNGLCKACYEKENDLDFRLKDTEAQPYHKPRFNEDESITRCKDCGDVVFEDNPEDNPDGNLCASCHALATTPPDDDEEYKPKPPCQECENESVYHVDEKHLCRLCWEKQRNDKVSPYAHDEEDEGLF